MKLIRDYIYIIIGTTLLAMSTTLFFEQHNLVTGGVVGIAIIVKDLGEKVLNLNIPLWITNLLLNIPLFLMAIVIKGKKFGIKSLISALYLSFALYFTSFIPEPTHDLLLSSLFGGITAGAGLGLVFLGFGTTGGTDLLSSIIKHFREDLSIGRILFVLDTAIIGLGFFTFGIEKGLYAVIAVYVFTKIMDSMIEGIHFAKALYIISDNSGIIAQEILEKLERGVTFIKGKGAYKKEDKDILMCIVRKREILKVKRIIKQIDKNAFVIVNDIREVLGEGFSV